MRVSIVGLGLIGGSLALALRGDHDVRAFDTDAATRRRARALALEVVDELAAVLPADLVAVATPLGAIVPTLRTLCGMDGTAVLLDVGSLKREVAAFAEAAPASARIVGGHPMAGTTGSGFDAANAALFRDRPFLLVPTARSDEAAMEAAGDLARAVGAVPTVCSAQVHDRAVAMLSALPLAIALALARTGADVAHLAGPGYRDATRLAATPPELARALLHGTRDELKATLRRFREALDAVEREI